MLICTLLACVDSLYWQIFKIRDSRIPPYEWWFRSAISGIGGAAGGFVIRQVMDSADLFTMIVGAIIGGRLIGGLMETFFNRR